MTKFITIISLAWAITTHVHAQSFDFDLTKDQPVYTDAIGYGYDILSKPTKKSTTPFYFSVKVPDGNYKVTLTLGDKKRASQTAVRAECRRLFFENVETKKGKLQTVEFVVNKRSTQIDEKNRVNIKDREKDYLHWDNKLTLEFNGAAPAVSRIKIERDNTATTVFLCGNSTVVDQATEPWASWGQMFPRWFNTNIAICNLAESGLTARTFERAHRLDYILAKMKKGDYVICEFGHNDEKEHSDGDGAWYHFAYELKLFVDKVRKAGGNILFCTPTARRSFDEFGKIKNTHGEFPTVTKTVGQRENVPVIDLTAMTTTLFETMGVEGSKKALVHYPAGVYGDRKLEDNTHFNTFGAYEVSKMVVMGLKQLNIPFVKELRTDWKDFNPAQPDAVDQWKWYDSTMVDTKKPDGN